MKKIKYLLLLIPFLFISNVKAEEVYSRGAEFNWCNAYTGSCSITELRYNDSAKVTLTAPYNATEYNKNNFEYLAGIRFWTWLAGNKNDVVSLYYTLTLTGLKQNETYSNDWLNEKNSFYSSSNVTILNSKLISNNYVEDKSPTNIEGNPVYLGTQTIKFKVNVQLNSTLSNQSIYVGFGAFSTSSGLSSKIIYQHIATVVTLFADNYYSIDNSSTIINQNDKIIEQNEKTNEELKKTNDTLKDDNTQQAQDSAGGFFNDFTTDTHGLTAIITAPLSLISKITSASCSPLVIPLPYVDKDLTLPCMGAIYSQYFGSFLSIYQVITFGIIAYWVCVRIFNLVKDFKNPDHDEIEVLDL